MTYPDHTPGWRRYLRFWRRDVQHDIDEEIRFHFEARREELVSQGRSEHEALAIAHAEFGDVGEVRRSLRAIDDRIARRRARMESLAGWRDDFTYAARALRRAPLLASTIVLTLALGLGMSSVMFSLLDALFLRPPAGIATPGTLRRVWVWYGSTEGGRFASQAMSYPQYAALVDRVPGATFALFGTDAKTPVRRGDVSMRANVVRASSNYFTLLGVRAARGRFFTAEEDQLGRGAHVAVVSDGFWRTQLAADSSAIGTRLVVGGKPYTVVGIAPATFTGLGIDVTDIWTPLATANEGSATGGQAWWTSPRVIRFTAILRLAPGASEPLVNREIAQVLRTSDSGPNRRDSTAAQTGSIITARGPGKGMKEIAIASRLGGVSIIVLLIACANVINLLLARAVTRRREIAVRLSLGMSKSRLVRLVVTESVLLALVAAAAAAIVTEWGGRLLRLLLLPDVRWADEPLQLRVVGFTLVAALVAGMFAGLVPALQATSLDLARTLKSSASAAGEPRSRVRSSLVAAQAALSVMLLVGAVLFIRSLDNVRALNIGFDAARLTIASVHFDDRDTRIDPTFGARLRQLADRIGALPGVERVALSSMEPMQGFSFMPFFVGTDSSGSRPDFFPTFTAVSRGFFDAVGLRLRRGGDFSPARAASVLPEVVVNETMAATLWPHDDPIGQCMHFEKRDAACSRVVGVVENARRGSVTEKPAPLYYVPLGAVSPTAFPANDVVIRTGGGAQPALTTAVRQLIRESFPSGEPIVTRMSDSLEPQYRPWRLGAMLFSASGALALIVSMIGIYSTMSYTVSQRTHEFGVRIALGARVADVVALVMRRGVRTVMFGVAAGLLLALLSGRFVSSLLYGVSPRDPVAMAIVAALLLVVGALASFVPAWRASRVDPVSALRAD